MPTESAGSGRGRLQYSALLIVLIAVAFQLFMNDEANDLLSLFKIEVSVTLLATKSF